MASLEHIISPTHPAADGHFPGNPIIPGSVLLSTTLRMIEARLGARFDRCHLKMAKFPASARPGDRLQIEFSGSAEEGLKFTAAVAGKIVLVGSITCAPPPVRI